MSIPERARISVWMLLCAALCLAGCAKGSSALDSDAIETADRRARADKNFVGCGNDKIEENEECDGVLLAGATCVSLNYVGGQLACDPVTCSYDVSMCVLPPERGAGGAGPD